MSSAVVRCQRGAGRPLPLAFFLLIALLSSACSGRVQPVVKIGLVAPFEGKERTIGYDVIYSVRLAIREVNRAGGVGGYRVALVALDDSGDRELARQAAAALVRDPKVVAVIGHWQADINRAAAPIYATAGLPLVETPGESFVPLDPTRLPDTFRDRYAALTPFDEVAGPYAGPAYDSVSLVLAAIEQVTESGETPARDNVMAALENLALQGITGQTIQR